VEKQYVGGTCDEDHSSTLPEVHHPTWENGSEQNTVVHHCLGKILLVQVALFSSVLSEPLLE
jgi:hypothetical protein